MVFNTSEYTMSIFNTEAYTNRLISNFNVHFNQDISAMEAEQMLLSLWQSFSKKLIAYFLPINPNFDEDSAEAYIKLMNYHVPRHIYFMYLESYSQSIQSENGCSLYSHATDGQEADFKAIRLGFDSLVCNDKWRNGNEFSLTGAAPKRKKGDRFYNLANLSVFFFVRVRKRFNFAKQHEVEVEEVEEVA